VKSKNDRFAGRIARAAQSKSFLISVAALVLGFFLTLTWDPEYPMGVAGLFLGAALTIVCSLRVLYFVSWAAAPDPAK